MKGVKLSFCILLTITLTILAGCSSYTYETAKHVIEPVLSIPETPPTATKLSEIQALKASEQAAWNAVAAEQLAKEEAIRAAQKTKQEAEAAEKLRIANEAARLAEEERRIQERAEILAREMVAAEKQRQLEIQQQQELLRLQQEAETKRQAAEEAARLAAEAAARLVAPVPNADVIKYPYQYQPLKETHTLATGLGKFATLMLPLPDNELDTQEATKLASEIVSSISDITAPIIFVTGNMQNVITLVNQLGRNAIILSEGAIVTSFPISSYDSASVTVTVQQGKDLQLLIANLPDYGVFSDFTTDPDGNWKTTVADSQQERLGQVKDILSKSSKTLPVLIGASFYEPSHMDWTSFSPVPYRTSFQWPISLLLEEEQFLDTYRMTHYSEETNSGITIRWTIGDVELQERIDYIFSKKLLPVDSTMLSLGGLSAPSDKTSPSRYALLGTYILP